MKNKFSISVAFGEHILPLLAILKDLFLNE
jgi:hypothetical protein